ncbi:MAG: DUF4249 domain-containing protein [Bacteroidia bacterium]|nr:DUF4249 domain-containing protein [Bacteroidia bacterium]
MKNIWQILLVLIILLFSSCITQFIPQTTEDRELLVVEGLITDKPETNTIKLSRPFHLGMSNIAKPITGCNVRITDDFGQSFSFNETTPGTYTSDPATFQGIIGRFYTLHISTNVTNNNLHYESIPMELRPVPPIDSIYYEKITLQESDAASGGQEGCQIFLDTHDPKNECKFYRWEYSETWEFRLPYMVPNSVCWISNNSDVINIKNTSIIEEDRINKYPLALVSNLTDRLRVKYSILVNQYSLNEDEYLYWEKLQNISEQVGGLYDMIPSAIPSNVYCLDDPNQKVLGYFSVSANSSRRIFIRERFAGVVTPYTDNACIADTVFGGGPIRYLNTYVWVIIDHPIPPPAYRVLTRNKGCYDCTVRGTNIKPDFWEGEK